MKHIYEMRFNPIRNTFRVYKHSRIGRGSIIEYGKQSYRLGDAYTHENRVWKLLHIFPIPAPRRYVITIEGDSRPTKIEGDKIVPIHDDASVLYAAIRSNIALRRLRHGLDLTIIVAIVAVMMGIALVASMVFG